MSDEKRHEIRDGFIRQRRNLLLISCVLLLATGSDIAVEEFNALGVHIAVSPGAVALTLWVLWLYWILRYWQYYHDLPDKEWREVFLHLMKNLVAKRLRALAQLEIEKHERGTQPEEDFLVTGYRLKGINVQEWSHTCWRGSITIEKQINVVDKSDDVINVVLTHSQLISEYLQAIWGLVIHTRLVSEYGLPLLVAFLPPLYAGYKSVFAT